MGSEAQGRAESRLPACFDSTPCGAGGARCRVFNIPREGPWTEALASVVSLPPAMHEKPVAWVRLQAAAARRTGGGGVLANHEPWADKAVDDVEWVLRWANGGCITQLHTASGPSRSPSELELAGEGPKPKHNNA
jgi:hypothetical protein